MPPEKPFPAHAGILWRGFELFALRMFDENFEGKESAGIPEKIRQDYAALDKSSRIENACDFCAFLLLMRSEELVNTILNICPGTSGEDLLACILFSAFAPELYNLIRMESATSKNDVNEQILRRLNNRWAFLMYEAKISCNSPRFQFGISAEALNSAMDKASKLVYGFLKDIGTAFEDVAAMIQGSGLNLHSNDVEKSARWHFFRI